MYTVSVCGFSKEAVLVFLPTAARIM
jgi:hypothetical protein